MAKIVIAGDFCPTYRVRELFEQDKEHDILSDFRPILQEADYSIVNLECPVVRPADSVKPIKKVGESLKCTPNAVQYLKDVGFSCVTLANNHFFDFGQKGVDTTIDVLEEVGLEYIGGGKSSENLNRILYKEIDGIKIAFISACENEFSIADSTHGGSYESDYINLYYAVSEAKANNSHRIILILHGGKEYYGLPTPEMQKGYRFLIDAGADVIINHHQHFCTGYEKYNNGIIFYGLGNFCFDAIKLKNIEWRQGFVVELDITRDSIDYSVIPYLQCMGAPEVRILESDECQAFMKGIYEKNRVIADSGMLSEEYNKHIMATYSSMSISPIGNEFLRKLAWHKIIPDFVSDTMKMNISHLIRCRSHREAFMKWMELTGEKIDSK